MLGVVNVVLLSIGREVFWQLFDNMFYKNNIHRRKKQQSKIFLFPNKIQAGRSKVEFAFYYAYNLLIDEPRLTKTTDKNIMATTNLFVLYLIQSDKLKNKRK